MQCRYAMFSLYNSRVLNNDSKAFMTLATGLSIPSRVTSQACQGMVKDTCLTFSEKGLIWIPQS